MKHKLIIYIWLLTSLQVVMGQDHDHFDIVNKHISVRINKKGAELSSLKNNKTNTEHIWQAQKPWRESAPILFPIVGKLKNKTYTYKDKTYRMKNHGFARTKNFELVKQNPDEVILLLKSDSETKKIYPFDFELTADYKLKCKKLKITYKVKNTGKDTMLFTIGSHPGFNVPFYPKEKFEQYYLEFEKEETADRLLLDPKTRLISGQIQKNYLNKQKTLPLNHQMFKKRVIILKDLQSKYVRIKSKNHTDYLEVGIKNFPYLGLWSPQKESNVICIEPWYGTSDYMDSHQKFEEKTGMIKLAPGEKFEIKYYIKVH